MPSWKSPRKLNKKIKEVKGRMKRKIEDKFKRSNIQKRKKKTENKNQ